MNIVPVIDLLNAQVVHAKQGDRASYQPIQTPLCPTSEALAMMNAIMQLHPFQRIYIADINAIQHRGNHHSIITKIKHQHPQLEIWLDAGFTNADTIQDYLSLDIHIVIGTESITSIDQYKSLMAACKKKAILSLDFKLVPNSKMTEYQGPKELLNDATLWPEQVIVMSLNKVGSQTGPDLEQLSKIQSAATKAMVYIKLYAAGGIRNIEDLLTLQQMGITGGLVASALHAGNISAPFI